MTKAQRALLALLVLSIFLNYIDRTNLSLAGPLLEREFSLPPSHMGALFSAFFWTYALLQLVGISGWLADRHPPGLVLAGGLFLWSAATIATGLVSGLAALFAMRLLVGAGESLAYPCYSRIFAEYPANSRGVANALLDAGSKLGPALGALLGGFLLVRTGWRMFFVLLGGASLLWLWPWLKLWRGRPCPPCPQSCGHPASANEPVPRMLRILRSRSAWGAFLGHFCGNYFWFFLLTWLPTYLVKARGFTMEEMGPLTSIAFFSIAGATVTAGWLSDRWIAAGGSITRVRKTIVVGGLGFSSVVLPVALVHGRTLSLALLLLGCLSFGTYTSNHWAITQTLAGPAAAGRWTSLQNGIGNLSGIVASWFTGIAVERTHSFAAAFVAAALVALAGAASWGAIVGPVRQVRWEEQ